MISGSSPRFFSLSCLGWLVSRLYDCLFHACFGLSSKWLRLEGSYCRMQVLLDSDIEQYRYRHGFVGPGCTGTHASLSLLICCWCSPSIPCSIVWRIVQWSQQKYRTEWEGEHCTVVCSVSANNTGCCLQLKQTKHLIFLY